MNNLVRGIPAQVCHRLLQRIAGGIGGGYASGRPAGAGFSGGIMGSCADAGCLGVEWTVAGGGASGPGGATLIHGIATCCAR